MMAQLEPPIPPVHEIFGLETSLTESTRSWPAVGPTSAGSVPPPLYRSTRKLVSVAGTSNEPATRTLPPQHGRWRRGDELGLHGHRAIVAAARSQSGDEQHGTESKRGKHFSTTALFLTWNHRNQRTDCRPIVPHRLPCVRPFLSNSAACSWPRVARPGRRGSAPTR